MKLSIVDRDHEQVDVIVMIPVFEGREWEHFVIFYDQYLQAYGGVDLFDFLDVSVFERKLLIGKVEVMQLLAVIVEALGLHIRMLIRQSLTD